jgi:hypothetical protein
MLVVVFSSIAGSVMVEKIKIGFVNDLVSILLEVDFSRIEVVAVKSGIFLVVVVENQVGSVNKAVVSLFIIVDVNLKMSVVWVSVEIIFVSIIKFEFVCSVENTGFVLIICVVVSMILVVEYPFN